MHFMLGQTFDNCLFLYKDALFYTLLNYSVNNASLPDFTVDTDRGVLVDNNLRFTNNYRSIVNKWPIIVPHLS